MISIGFLIARAFIWVNKGTAWVAKTRNFYCPECGEVMAYSKPYSSRDEHYYCAIVHCRSLKKFTPNQLEARKARKVSLEHAIYSDHGTLVTDFRETQ